MTELRALLERASTGAMTTMPADDLARGRTALRRQRRWRGGVAGLTAAAVLGAGGAALLGGPPATAPIVHEDQAHDVTLVAASLSVGPYTIGKIPEGWEVQGVSPYAVTIAPTDGSVDADPNVFVGKLVVLYDLYPPSGRAVEHDGRIFHIGGNSDSTSVSVATRPGEPEGTVTVQYPDDTWPDELMIEFADAVVVNDTARPGVG